MNNKIYINSCVSSFENHKVTSVAIYGLILILQPPLHEFLFKIDKKINVFDLNKLLFGCSSSTA